MCRICYPASYIIEEELLSESRAHLKGCLKAMGRERMGRKAGNRVLLNKTLDLYLSSYQIYTKSMVWFRKYQLFKNSEVEIRGIMGR